MSQHLCWWLVKKNAPYLLKLLTFLSLSLPPAITDGAPIFETYLEEMLLQVMECLSSSLVLKCRGHLWLWLFLCREYYPIISKCFIHLRRKTLQTESPNYYYCHYYYYDFKSICRMVPLKDSLLRVYCLAFLFPGVSNVLDLSYNVLFVPTNEKRNY